MADENKTTTYWTLIVTVLITQAVTGFTNYRVNSSINDTQFNRQKALSDYQKRQTLRHMNWRYGQIKPNVNLEIV